MLHGLAELGEGGEGLLGLLTLDLSSLLLLLSKTEWKGRLALLGLGGLGGGLSSGLSGNNSLSRDGGGAGDAGSEGLRLLNGRDNWGLGAGDNLVILGWDNWGSLGRSLLGSKSGLEVKEGRVALGCSRAGLWDSSLLDNGGLSNRGLNRGSSLLNNGGLDGGSLSNGLLLSDSLVGGDLLLLATQVESTEDGVALAAGRAALGACLLLLLGLLLSLLLLVLGLGLLGGDSLLLLLVLLLLLNLGDNGWLAQASKLLLVTLAASDGLGALLGLGGLLLESSDPAVTVNKVGGLENVLLAVADE